MFAIPVLVAISPAIPVAVAVPVPISVLITVVVSVSLSVTSVALPAGARRSRVTFLLDIVFGFHINIHLERFLAVGREDEQRGEDFSETHAG